MKDNLHIVSRNLSRKEAQSIRNDAGGYLFWYDSRYIIQDLEHKTYQSRISNETKKRINYDIIDRILKLSDIKIEGISLSSFLSIEKMNFWFYQRLNLYMFWRNAEYLLEELRCAPDDLNIILYSYLPDGCFEDPVFKNVDIRFAKAIGRNLNSKKWKIAASMFFALLKGIYFRPDSLISDKHLLIDNARPVSLFDPVNKKTITGNYVLGNVFKLLDTRFTIIQERGLPGKRIATKSQFRNSFQYSKLSIDFFSADIIIAKAILKSRIRKKYREVRNNLAGRIEQVKNKLSTDKYSILRYYLSVNLQSNNIYILRYLGFRDLIKSKNPLSVSASDENSPFTKCLLDAASSLGIKTTGIQHGAIHELHPAYRFTAAEIKSGILPDKTLVWGNKWKNILTNISNYPANSVIITGQARTDSVNELISLEDNAQRSSGIILFASQPQRDPLMRARAANALFLVRMINMKEMRDSAIRV